jgi:hypothetical protein
MWVWAGIVGVLVAAWSIWRWTTLPEAGIAVMGFAALLLTVAGTVDDRLKNLMREGNCAVNASQFSPTDN